MHRLTHVVAMAACGLFAGCTRGLVITGREQWIQRQVPRLLALRPRDDIPALEIERQADHIATVRGHEGLVRLAHGEWVFFTMCSSHTPVPDVIIVVGSEGRLYACNGHVCPDLELTWPKGRRPGNPLSLADFASSRVFLKPGGRGSRKWLRVDEWREGIRGEAEVGDTPGSRR